MTGAGDTASYLQGSWYLKAVLVAMPLLSWPFFLPTFEKYLSICNLKSKNEH